MSVEFESTKRASLAVLLALGIGIAASQAYADGASQRSAGLAACRSSCQQQGSDATFCAQYCNCVESQVEAATAGKTLGTPGTDFSPTEQQQLPKIVLACIQLVSSQFKMPQAPSGGGIAGLPSTLQRDPLGWQTSPGTFFIPGIGRH
jgi:hypothetical protein